MNTKNTKTIRWISTLAMGAFLLLSGVTSQAFAGPGYRRVIRVDTPRTVKKKTRPVRKRKTQKTTRTRLKTASTRPKSTTRTRSIPKSTAPEMKLIVGLEAGGVYQGLAQGEDGTLGVRLSSIATDPRSANATWLGIYGRLQVQPNAGYTRMAAGLTAGFDLLNVDLGVVSENAMASNRGEGVSNRNGNEFSIALGLLDSLGVYARLVRFEDGDMLDEFGLRLNLPLAF